MLIMTEELLDERFKKYFAERRCQVAAEENKVEEINTTNDQLVGKQMGEDLVTVAIPRNIMTKEEAIRHAAWLVILASDTELTVQ